MKTVLKVLSGLAIALGLSGAIVYFIYPGVLLGFLQSAAVSNAGLSKKSIDVNGYQAHYYEGGDSNSPALVLLHGFSDNKYSFVTSVNTLTQQYRVILPDLQGHGDNARLEELDHSIGGQVRHISELLNQLDVSKAVIGGNSMGGHIAAAYTLQNPQKAEALIVINATGVQLDNESVYEAFPESVDPEFFKQFFERIYVNPPQFPEPMLQHFANELNARIPFYNKTVKQIETGPLFRLNEELPRVAVPALVLWGKEDPIVPIDYAELYAQQLSGATLKILPNTGHSPQYETPDVVQQELSRFMQQVHAE